MGKVTACNDGERVAAHVQQLESFQGLEGKGRHVGQAIVIQQQFFQRLQADERIVIDSRDMIEGEDETPQARQ